MAYHIFVSEDGEENLVLDKYLGSAVTVDMYWESVGRELSLPIISSITERSDSEGGFVLEGGDLLKFKNEINQLEGFWEKSDSGISVPEYFFSDLAELKSGIDQAFSRNLQLIIG